ncbi:MAG: Na+-transporting NADH:ubiquinone oxidoreductase subunit [Thermodesulfobacteriota bacterium]|jgi:Na+-transporting NADH:ubiquinone oxidoreductase subunit E|nr:Na+-transporting NADH:ubiquinone oxidoreductase subunit [Thermodesulfobacteriota bacterium]
MEDISILVLFLASIFTSNILLTNFLGMCSYLSVSRELKTAWGLGVSVVFVMAITSVANYLVYYYLLVPLGLEYLQYIAFIVVIAALVQIVEMVVERVSERLYASLGIFLPLITVNCAILGASLFLVIRRYDLVNSLVFGLGSGLGWLLAIMALAGIRLKMAGRSKVIPALEGPGIVLIVTGIIALGFIGFSGIVQIN